MPRVAIVLAGCGVYDGSEIHEAVSLLLHLSRQGVDYRCFAPDKEQAHVVNHLAGQPVDGEQRNVLTEAARIARGEISSLNELNVDDYDALFAPGGFGAAKNLCTFASEGSDCTVDPEVERVFREFHAASKPIGVCCITPVIPAKVFGTKAGGPGCTVTVGEDRSTAQAIELMGSRHRNAPVDEACVDEENRLVTAPAYMYADAKVHEVYDGIGQMVEKTLALVGAGARA